MEKKTIARKDVLNEVQKSERLIGKNTGITVGLAVLLLAGNGWLVREVTNMKASINHNNEIMQQHINQKGIHQDGFDKVRNEFYPKDQAATEFNRIDEKLDDIKDYSAQQFHLFD